MRTTRCIGRIVAVDNALKARIQYGWVQEEAYCVVLVVVCERKIERRKNQ